MAKVYAHICFTLILKAKIYLSGKPTSICTCMHV